jgi:hypothetical protein
MACHTIPQAAGWKIATMMKHYAGLRDAWRSREAVAARGVPVIPGCRACAGRCYVDAVKVRPREAADQAAAQAFLARHDSARVARLGELVHPLDHQALVAEAAGGRLLGMLTYVPGRDWQQCEMGAFPLE